MDEKVTQFTNGHVFVTCDKYAFLMLTFRGLNILKFLDSKIINRITLLQLP